MRRMRKSHGLAAEFLTPILRVRDFREAVEYYTKTLLFELKWEWGQPASFGCVSKGKAEIFFCWNGQGRPGMWLCCPVVDVDEYYERIKGRGAEVIYGPKDEPWGLREIHVRDPNEHVIRFGHGIPTQEPRVKFDSAEVKTRMEKRLASLARDLAAQKKSSVGEM